MTGKLQVLKNVERSGRSLIEVTSRHLQRWTKKSYEATLSL